MVITPETAFNKLHYVPLELLRPALLCWTYKLTKLRRTKKIAPKERVTEIGKYIVYFTRREIELQSKLITLLKRPLFLISFCTAAEAPRRSHSLNEG